MINIMTDLETLGTDPHTSPIIAIGACCFENEETFEASIEFKSACVGRIVNPNTAKWWLEQSEESQLKAVSGTEGMRDALVRFANWINKVSGGNTNDVTVWGNGVAFDIEMLKSVMSLYGITPPWKYWNELDVRTIDRLSKLALGADKRAFPFEGVKHSALADAIHQRKYVMAMMKGLGAIK